MNWEIAGVIAEITGAVAVFVSLIYLARQIRVSNRLARAEAYRSTNNAQNSLNATFAGDPVFRSAWRRCLEGACRKDLEEDERILIDGFLISVTNIHNQLLRESREGIVDPEECDYDSNRLFSLPYYRDSWPFYRGFISSTLVEDFEKSNNLDSSIEFGL